MGANSTQAIGVSLFLVAFVFIASGMAQGGNVLLILAGLAGVAASCARAASEGAYFNVMINIAQLEDSSKAASTAARAKALLDETAALSEGVLAMVRSSLESPAAGGERKE